MNVAAWIEERRAALQPEVHPVPWATNVDWEFRDGALCHVRNAFFSVVGLRVSELIPGMSPREFPIIDQPEVGLLGFVVSGSQDDPHWLLQAKSEPGSVGYVQVGPTVQATESNFKRRHGGAPTRYFDLFHDAQRPPLVDTPQSEQGSRFLGKYNRNAIRILDDRFEAGHPSWRWFDAAAVKRALQTDFLINTDARSVMVCSPWRLLAGERGPFAPRDDAGSSVQPETVPAGFVEALRESHRCAPADVDGILERLAAETLSNPIRVEQRPLELLDGWEIDDHRLFSRDPLHDLEIGNYAVRAPGREVESWHQPLLEVLRGHVAGLILQHRGGRLAAYLRFAREPGFGKRVQLGPSYQSDGANPRWIEELAMERSLPRVLSVRQSDEGGRFMRSIVDYAVHVVDASPQLPDDEGVWVDLAEIESLCRVSGAVTNEGRSVVSLLLALA